MSDLPHALIQASAGTGKTFQLSNRYLSLLQCGVAPDEILATTFTRKAAGEILDRIMSRLAAGALDAGAARELGTFIRAPALTVADCCRMLRRTVNQLHRLRICTLDAFFAQLAGSFALELGLSASWSIIDPTVDAPLRTAAIEATLHAGRGGEIHRVIQLMAKGNADRAVATLVRRAVDGLYELYLETPPAAWECVPRPRLLTDDELVAAIDALRSAPLPTHKKIQEAHLRSIAQAESGDWLGFTDKGIGSKIVAGETSYYRKPIAAETVDAYRTMLLHARAVLLNQVANQSAATYTLLHRFHEHYDLLKRQRHALSFADVTRVLVDGPVVGDIAAQAYRIDAHLQHLLLDEFQDTSLIQWQALRPLAQHIVGRSEAPAPPGTVASSFFCVGDSKQAIYGWRGGRAEIFEALGSELGELSCTPLNASYRSSQPVIDTVNRIFTNCRTHANLNNAEAAVRSWCDKFPQHTTTRDTLPGFAELCSAALDADDKPSNDLTLEYTADRIATLAQTAPTCKIGALVRTNDQVGQLIYELRARGVPASEEGGNPLTDSAAVQLVLSLLRMTDHPDDSVARYHLARSPLAATLALPDYTDIDRALVVACEVRTRLMKLGYGATVSAWARQLAPACDPREWSRLQQLVEMAFQYEAIATLRATDFVRHVEKTRVADPSSSRIRVMTVHQAKGLQFDAVFLPLMRRALTKTDRTCVVGQPTPTERVDRVCMYRNEAIQHLMPKSIQQMFATTLERTVHEALCVLYVALTRAVHALYMIVPPSTASEKKLPATAAGLLRAGLTDGARLEPLQIAYQTGNPQWYEPARAATPAAAATATTQQPVADRPIVMAVPDSAPISQHTSPSQLEGGAKTTGRRALRLTNHAAMARGTLIHAMFEQVEWLDEGLPERAHLVEVVTPLLSPTLDLDELLDAFFAMLAQPATRAALRRDFYRDPSDDRMRQALSTLADRSNLTLEVLNERPFVVRDADRVLSGSIDRLVVIGNGARPVAADVVDFKTDLVTSDGERSLSALCHYYRPQLDAYRRAVQQIYKLPEQNVAAHLLFVSAGQMVSVEGLLN